ncbi:MAG: hypothetical protein J6035_00065, partial [Bacteroidaceae bacterium]|nr:hypothetical protein [Bacteroidaceae bacterium]
MRWLASLLCSLSIFASSLSLRADAGEYIIRAAQWNRLYPQEKVYLHLDNTAYFLGETIWMKAYVTRSDTENRSNISRVLYVELISPRGFVVERRKLQVTDGLAWGDIKLTKRVLKPGYYEIRAYTRYMTNWGKRNFFSRVFPVFDKPRTEGDYSHMSLEPYDVTRQPDERRASVSESENVDRDIRITELPDSVCFEADKGCGWALLHGSNIIAGNTIREGEHVRLSLARQKMKEGLWQMVLFDEAGKEITHRDIVIAPKADRELKITVRTAGIRPCGRISLDIQGPPHTAFSFSAIDAATVCNGFQEDIREWMLRKSENWHRYDWNTMAGITPWDGSQVIEDRLYLFGKVIPKKKNMPLDSVTVSATFRGTTERMFGSVKTDSTGAYAIILPDIEGIWNMQLSPQVKGKEAEYRITVDRHFAPALRPLEDSEVRQIPVDTARIHRWQIAPQDEQEWQNMYEKNATVMKEVNVKGKRKLDHYNYNAFTNTEDAEHFSEIYFDCEEAAEDIADRGEEIPELTAWLVQTAGRYREDSYGQGPSYSKDPGEEAAKIKHFPTWNGRHVVWYVDNQPVGGIWYPCPVLLDEYQSVYISDSHGHNEGNVTVYAYSYEHDTSKWS